MSFQVENINKVDRRYLLQLDTNQHGHFDMKNDNEVSIKNMVYNFR